jgi:hypothetical protein
MLHSAWRQVAFARYAAQPSWTLTPVKPGRMPIAAVAAPPRLGGMA